MPKIINYLDQISIHYHNLIATHGLEIQQNGDYGLKLIGKRCGIEMLTNKYYNELIVLIINPISNKSYNIVNILDKKDLLNTPVSYFHEVEKIEDEFEKKLYMNAKEIEQNCQDILSGDFSIMEAP